MENREMQNDAVGAQPSQGAESSTLFPLLMEVRDQTNLVGTGDVQLSS